MEDRFCACGCGEPVLAKRSDARYASKTCVKRHWQKSEKGREYKRRWKTSEKGRESDRRWKESEKAREANRRRYVENREKIREKSHRWYVAHREKVLESNRRWRKANPGKNAEYARRFRLKVLAAFGNKCAHCGISDVRVLDIDHRNGGGTAEHQALGPRKVYRKALREALAGDFSNYSLLCKNCNWLKAHENGELKRKRNKHSNQLTNEESSIQVS